MQLPCVGRWSLREDKAKERGKIRFFSLDGPKMSGNVKKKRKKLEGCREVGERELSMRRERRDSGDDAKALLEWIGGR